MSMDVGQFVLTLNQQIEHIVVDVIWFAFFLIQVIILALFLRTMDKEDVEYYQTQRSFIIVNLMNEDNDGSGTSMYHGLQTEYSRSTQKNISLNKSSSLKQGAGNIMAHQLRHHLLGKKVKSFEQSVKFMKQKKSLYKVTESRKIN